MADLLPLQIDSKDISQEIADKYTVNIRYDVSGSVKGYIEVPFNGTISSVRLLAGITGTLTVDIWNDTYTNYPPLDADTITGSSPMKLVGAMKAEETALGGWQTGVTAGDILTINVDGCTTITSATLSIRGTKG